MEELFNKICAAGGGKKYLLTETDKEATTYFEDPKHPDQAYFSFIDTSSQDALAAYLNNFWAGLNTPEFAVAANDLSALAFQLKAAAETQSDDVSPFIYAMY